MSKVRKSRDQKVKASLRQHNYHIDFPQETYKAEAVAQKQTSSAVSLDINTYIRKDISKTMILTFLLLGVQIITFFLLRNHNLPFLGINY